MAVVQDRSAEDERDLAQLEMGMLMDTASVGVATYDPARGWLAPGAPVGARSARRRRRRAARLERPAGHRPRTGASPARCPNSSACSVRCAPANAPRCAMPCATPSSAQRWLLTRVEPGALAGGRATTSVVTLDVTEQESAQRRNEQLLRELTTILDSSTAGIAYLRGPLLVRCNRRFERMLGLEPGAAAGASLEEIFGRSFGPLGGAREALEALAQGQPFDAELPLAQARAPPTLWYSLSVRRAQPEGGPSEAVAVLTDITRLKTQQAELEKLLRDRELMFSLSDVGIVYQRGARIERANQAMAVLTGYSAPELNTLDAAELYEDARACVDFEAQVAQGLREHGRYSGERLLRRRDGSLTWVQVAVRARSTAATRRGRRLICSFVDVDERHRARESLAAQAERTRAILNSVLVGIVTVSERGIEWMNRSARRMFGGELADFVGEPISIVATPEPDHPLRSADHLHRLQEGQAETFECRLKGRDGREFWVVGNAVLTRQRRRRRRARADHRAAGHRAPAPGRGAASRRRRPRCSASSRPRRWRSRCSTAAACACSSSTRRRPPSSAGRCSRCWAARPRTAARRPRRRRCASGCAVRPPRARPASTNGARRPGATPEGARVWDCRIAPLDEGGVGAAQLLLVASDVTEQRAAERRACRPPSRSARCWCAKCTTASRTTCRAWPGCCSRTRRATPSCRPCCPRRSARCRPSPRSTACRSAPAGRWKWPGCCAPSPRRCSAPSVARSRWSWHGEVPHLLPEAESIPVALTVNELLTNAIKHGAAATCRCRLAVRGDDVRIRIASAGTLPAGFDLAQVRGGVSGWAWCVPCCRGAAARLTLAQQGAEVVAEVELRPPSVRLPSATAGGGGRSTA